MEEGALAAQVFKTKTQARLSAADAKKQNIELYHADASPKIVGALCALEAQVQKRGRER